MSEFEIICLANSRKRQGRCVAGIRLDGEGWIRPVGWNAEGTLYPNNYFLPDGTETSLLDVLRIACVKPRPEVHHPENWLIKQQPWTLISRPASDDILPILNQHLFREPAIFGDTSDRVSYQKLREHPLSTSLALVLPDQILWIIQPKPSGGKQIRVHFFLGGVFYDLPLTDQNWESRLNALPIGIHNRQKAGLQQEDIVLLTISLSEPFYKDLRAEKICHKLVAAVIVVPASWREALRKRQ